MNLFITKPVQDAAAADSGLKRSLTATQLTMLGIGAVIGAGIFVLSGHAAAEHAGPAIVLSFIVLALQQGGVTGRVINHLPLAPPSGTGLR